MSQNQQKIVAIVLMVVLTVVLLLLSQWVVLLPVETAALANLAGTNTPTPVGGEIWWMWDGAVTVIPRPWFATPTPEEGPPTTTMTPSPTVAPTRTPVPPLTPTLTPYPAGCFVQPAGVYSVNIRSGPGTGYAVVDTLAISEKRVVYGSTINKSGERWLWLNTTATRYVARWVVKVSPGSICPEVILSGP